MIAGCVSPLLFRKSNLANDEALAAYITKPYTGRITLFKARQREWSEMVNPEPLWRKLAAGGLSVVVCEGNHASLLLEPNVKSLAQQLEKVLNASENSGK